VLWAGLKRASEESSLVSASSLRGPNGSQFNFLTIHIGSFQRIEVDVRLRMIFTRQQMVREIVLLITYTRRLCCLA
jgi:hypothetical protein